VIKCRLALYVLVAASTVVASLAAAASAAHPLSVSAYRVKASGICTVAKRAESAVPQPKSGETAVAVKGWKALVKIEETEIVSLKRLVPPSKLAPLVRTGLADKAKQVTVYKSALAKVQAGMPLLQAASLMTAAPDDSRVWAKVGVAVCQY
jgi:hypothetical protein